MEEDEKYLPWIEKYRPKNFDEIIAHEDILKILTRFIENNNLPHLLFYGPPGTCKTTTGRAIAQRIYGTSLSSMVLELNASDERGIEVVRDKIKEFACTKKMFHTGVKFIILDEVDAMTNDAQCALRRIIEKYTNNARFCLICNYVNKVIPALQSRCTRFRFTHLQQKEMVEYLNMIIEKEKIRIEKEAKEAILMIAKGDMRKVLNLLQSVSFMKESSIKEKDIYVASGLPIQSDMDYIIQILLNENLESSMKKIDKIIYENGYSLSDIIEYIGEYLKVCVIPEDELKRLYKQLSDIEYYLSFSSNEKIQSIHFISIFHEFQKKIGLNEYKKKEGKE